MQITLNIHDLTCDLPLPPLYRVRQRWSSAPLADIPGTVCAQLDDVGLRERLTAGARIAITAGSRGIQNIDTVLRACVDWLKGAGAAPFIVPAMGSHGGATAAGQVRLLAEFGITETTMGCPIHASMEVVELGQLPDGTPVCMDRYAAEADGVLVVNRIKAHTSFKGPIESGLAKMCAIGLGKRQGAEYVHNRGVYGLSHQLVPMARMVVERGRVLAGLAMLEDAREQTAELVALPPDEIGGGGEAALLERSKAMMARLPFDELEVLVVDEIGKNISGTGMDTNVIGRLRISGEAEPAAPRISVIVALDVSSASHGNANGVGLADLIPARLAQKIDFAAMYINNLTSGLIGLRKGALPIVLPTPRDTVAMALKVCGQPDLAAIRLVRIPNTLLLEELLVSAALLPEVAANPNLELLGPAAWEGL
ncbi:MAG: nickel-dependent lactate racemase [Chloroflexaceae bacterium]|jgi:hypothetical protein|nr:nickel-dependent lactate racemase [Chloroflexaceae bacterium]